MKMVWERTQTTSNFKTASNSFKAKREKGEGKPFPCIPAPLNPWQDCQSWYMCHICILVYFHVFVCSLLLQCMFEV